MPLILTLHRAREPVDRQRESRSLDQGTLSIGRGTGNGWVLQDPAQHLSKVHCTVTSSPRGYVLTDLSSNGVFLNGSRQRMARDSQALLNDGDEWALGDYLIRARVVADLSRSAVAAGTAGGPRNEPPSIDRDDPFGLDDFLAAPPPAPPPPVPSTRPPAAPAPRFDPFADPAAFRREDPFGDGFDDLLDGSPTPHRPFNDPTPPPRPVAQDPFDVLDGKAPFDKRSERDGAEQQGRRVRDAFGDDDDLFSGARPAVEWQGPSQPDNVDAVSHALVQPRTVPAPLPAADNWDDLLGDTPPGASPQPPAPLPATPLPATPPPVALPAAAPHAVAAPVAAPPVAAPPAAATAPPQPAVVPGTAPGPDAGRLVAAFLEGAGVPRLDAGKDDPEAYLRAAGELFASMVESLRDVLMSRAVVKGEFGVEQTMLRPRDNNALKFSVTPEDAVSALLQPGRPGYMAPSRAVREAFDDVRVHQLAVMAGVQAALMNLLRTFDPVALETRLQKGGMIESILPATRRAKLWEAFCATYKDIARDADSDFQAVFGREFARAYSEQAKASR